MRYHHEDKNEYFKVCQCALLSARGRQDSSNQQVADVDSRVLGLGRFKHIDVVSPAHSVTSQTAPRPSENAGCLKCTWRSMEFLPVSSMFSPILLRLCNFWRLNRSASALGAQNMDVKPRSAPTLPVKPTRRSTQVGLFRSQQGSSGFCPHKSLIKTGLWLYLHVTFSLKETVSG